MDKDYFSYNNGEGIVPDGAFRISASSVHRFFDYTSDWYRTELLKEEGFTGNTATHLGTCVHAGIEMFVDTGHVDYESIHKYIFSITDPEIDKSHILNQIEPMINTALPFVSNNKPTEVEKFVWHEILPGIGVGGSIDALKGVINTIDKDLNDNTIKINYDIQPLTIMDWKTTSLKQAPTKFSRSYWFQQMTYAWVLKQQNIDVEFIKLVFITQNETNRYSEKTGKPLKDYPSQISVVTEQVTSDSLKLIEGCLNVIAESVKVFNEQPELRHLLAQDSRLKVKPKRTNIFD